MGSVQTHRKEKICLIANMESYDRVCGVGFGDFVVSGVCLVCTKVSDGCDAYTGDLKMKLGYVVT